MDQIVVGVTTYGRNKENNYYLPAEYIEAIRAANGIPVLLPPGDPHWHDSLHFCDAFVLTGGGDINPSCYGGTRHETIYKVDDERDQAELLLSKCLLQHRIPTLAICRGMQIINVALGGTLYTHLPDHFGDTIAHRIAQGQPCSHEISIDQTSQLANIIPHERIDVVSLHHQAINQLAEELIVVAKADDGVIEAVELPNNPNLIAIQWHPELSSKTDNNQRLLFQQLIELAKQEKYHASRK